MNDTEIVEPLVEPVQEISPEPAKKYKGVYQQKGSKKYYAMVYLNKGVEGKSKQKYVGSYTTQEEAAVARNAYIEEYGLTCPKTEI